MPTIYRNAQLQGTAAVGTYANLYNTTAATTAVVSTIAITNTASSAATYRISIVPATASAATPSASNWLVYDAAVPGNDTVFITAGITLGNSQFIRVSSSANTATFSAYISEIS